MLLRYHRNFALFTYLLLAAPLAVGLVLPDNPDLIRREGRLSAKAPAFPVGGRELLDFSANVDAYLKDHFGLREKMIRLHKDLTKPVFFPDNQIAIYGASGRMFMLADDMVLQSAGRVMREQRVEDASNLLARMHDLLQLRGIKFLVAPPPNSSTTYQDDLPKWARNPGKRTEYDLLLESLATRGVNAIDLRPALSAARTDGPTYLINDLHWNVRGTVAGFNAVVEADEHPDWRINPASTIGPLAVRKGGDIARMIGVQDSVGELSETLNLPSVGTSKNLEGGNHIIVSGGPGPTILLLGDSFTSGDFLTLLSHQVGRAIWIHHEHCGFDWAWIDKVHPQEVWWMPVERFLLCQPGRSPANFG